MSPDWFVHPFPQMPSPGRPASSVWRAYDKRRDILGNPRARCKGCGAEISGVVRRLEVGHPLQGSLLILLCPQVHAIGCQALAETGILDPPDLEQEYSDEEPAPSEAAPSQAASAASSAGSATTEAVARPPKRKRLNQAALAVVRTPADLQCTINNQLCLQPFKVCKLCVSCIRSCEP